MDPDSDCGYTPEPWNGGKPWAYTEQACKSWGQCCQFSVTYQQYFGWCQDAGQDTQCPSCQAASAENKHMPLAEIEEALQSMWARLKERGHKVDHKLNPILKKALKKSLAMDA